MTVAFGSDHGGYKLKQELIAFAKEEGIDYQDFGCFGEESCDYPDMAVAPCKAVLEGKCQFAVLLCGTGIGISMAANKIKGIRAACCSDYYSAKFTRLHNDANVLCMGGRVVGPGLAKELLSVFIHTDFEAGRHCKRIEKIAMLENNN